MITSGATEAIAGALMALIEPGDEVVLFQPLYDAYLPLVQRAGGVPRFVRLEPPHWRFNEEQLARAFTPKTARGAVQQSAQSVRHRVPARGPRAAGALLREVQRHRGVRRGVGARHVRRPPPRPADRDAGHARALRQDRFGGKDLLAHRLEGRAWCARRRTCCACLPRRTSTSPSRRRRTCRPRWPTGSARPTIISRGCAPTCSAAATASPAGLRSLGFPVIEAEATYFVNVDLASLGLNEDDETLLQAPRARAQGRGDSGIGVLRQRADPLGGALLLRQARRDARCRARTARAAR